MRTVRLREIAHARTGDKGDDCNVALIVYDKNDYDLIRSQVTAERVKRHYRGIVKGEVERYELPNLGALNFVLRTALGGGATRSLAIDAHGKSIGCYLLELEVEKD